MSEATANIVAKTGDSVTFTFTPQANGYANLAGAALFDPAGKQLQQWQGQNVIQFQAANGSSSLVLAYLDGPIPETWNLSYTTAGNTTQLFFPGLSIQNAPSALRVFGT